jgi:hypothetical protein
LLHSVAKVASFSLMDSMVSLRHPMASTRASKKLAVRGGSVLEPSFGLAVLALQKASLIAMSLHWTILGLGLAIRVRATLYAMVVSSGFAAHHMNWTNFWQCSTEAIFLFSQRISDPTMCPAQACPNLGNELCAFSAMQGTKKGGTGIKQPASNYRGCLFNGDAFLKALAVANNESFDKGGMKDSPALSSSPPLRILAKQSLGVRPIATVDFWSPTRATSAGSGANFC